MLTTILRLKVLGAALVIGVGLSGCGGSGSDATQNDAGQVSEAGGIHDAWWCGEHGVPEDQCALCDVTLVAEFKAKGDWCSEHNRPDSQCFTCHPEREAEFAALYEAKYGEPPPPVGTPHGEDHDHVDSHDHDTDS